MRRTFPSQLGLASFAKSQGSETAERPGTMWNPNVSPCRLYQKEVRYTFTPGNKRKRTKRALRRGLRTSESATCKYRKRRRKEHAKSEPSATSLWATRTIRALWVRAGPCYVRGASRLTQSAPRRRVDAAERSRGAHLQQAWALRPLQRKKRR